MGARLLLKLLEQPLIDYAMITQRLDAVKMLKENMITREEIGNISVRYMIWKGLWAR